jgi:hypothetical protein
MSAAELARQLEVPTSADLWLNLQSFHESRLAQKRGGEIHQRVTGPRIEHLCTRGLRESPAITVCRT